MSKILDSFVVTMMSSPFELDQIAQNVVGVETLFGALEHALRKQLSAAAAANVVDNSGAAPAVTATASSDNGSLQAQQVLFEKTLEKINTTLKSIRQKIQ